MVLWFVVIFVIFELEFRCNLESGSDLSIIYFIVRSYLPDRKLSKIVFEQYERLIGWGTTRSIYFANF